MKKYFILFVLLFGFNIWLYSQECGTVSSTNYQTYERTKQERGFDRTNIEFHPKICLNVYYHIVRNNDGTGNGINENTLAQMTSSLNLD